MKHANIALFVPHEGCPHRCVFCDQRTISGQTQRVTEADIDKAVDIAVRSPAFSPQDTEIAFFGGSFTAIDREYMLSLLRGAEKYVRNGTVRGIRCSTRPDAIDDEVLDIYSSFGGTTIELGCQSMDDRVLAMNRRGHTSEDTERASRLIKAHGLSLGVQMMTGMYGDTEAGAVETAEKLISLEPECARIYPTIVLDNTALGVLYKRGEYKAQTLEAAVALCAKLLRMFEEKNISVIKLGLHASNDVGGNALAGPYHPAFRELCESRIYLENAEKLLSLKPAGEYALMVSSREISKATGQKKSNISLLAQRGWHVRFVQSEEMEKYELRLVD